MLVTDPTFHGVPAFQYAAREAAGLSALVGVSCFSLVAVLGLLFLMAVRTLISVSTRLVDPYLHRRSLHGLIGPLRARISSSELMLPFISSAS